MDIRLRTITVILLFLAQLISSISSIPVDQNVPLKPKARSLPVIISHYSKVRNSKPLTLDPTLAEKTKQHINSIQGGQENSEAEARNVNREPVALQTSSSFAAVKENNSTTYPQHDIGSEDKRIGSTHAKDVKKISNTKENEEIIFKNSSHLIIDTFTNITQGLGGNKREEQLAETNDFLVEHISTNANTDIPVSSLESKLNGDASQKGENQTRDTPGLDQPQISILGETTQSERNLSILLENSTHGDQILESREDRKISSSYKEPESHMNVAVKMMMDALKVSYIEQPDIANGSLLSDGIQSEEKNNVNDNKYQLTSKKNEENAKEESQSNSNTHLALTQLSGKETEKDVQDREKFRLMRTLIQRFRPMF